MRWAAAIVIFSIGFDVVGASRPPAFRPDGYNLRARGPLAAAMVDFTKTDVTLDGLPLTAFGGEPPLIGVVRPFANPYQTNVAQSSGPRTLATFRSTGAARVRLHLTNVAISAEEQLWVYGATGDASPFGRELLGPNSDIWTPSVDGDTIAVGFTSTSHFTIAEIVHIMQPVVTSTGCLSDVSCTTFADREVLSRSVARLVFVKGSGSYLCSGGLINGPDGDRLFLTANHCISTQAEASSLELTWDFRGAFCGAPTAPTSNRTYGATLLVTSSQTDVTLLRLTSLPAGRALMGWDTARPSSGTKLYRISHPTDEAGHSLAQGLSTTIVDESTSTCPTLPRPRFLYSSREIGGTAGGSSGAPVIVAGGYIVGQLLGVCGVEPVDACASLTRAVDGSLTESYPSLQPYLDPQPTSCVACSPSNSTACLLGGRFAVTMTWNDTGAHLSGAGSIVKYADNLPEVHPQFGPVSESVFFSMYSFAPKSIETLVRMLKGQNINNKYWVFVTGFTGAEYTVTVQDTQTCQTWRRTIPYGATSVTKDFEAFPFP
jgi:hypothetical protein